MLDSELYDSSDDLSSLAHESVLEDDEFDDAERLGDRDIGQREQIYDHSDQTRTTTQATKAIEAAEERSLEPGVDDFNATTGSPQSPYALPLGRTAWEDDVPILDAGPAPPDYFAATAWRLRATSANSTLPQDPESREVQSRDGEAAQPHQSFVRQNANDDDIEAGELYEDRSIDQVPVDETSSLLGGSNRNASKVTKGKWRMTWICTQHHCCILFVALVAVVVLTAAATTRSQRYRSIERRKHAEHHGDPALDHPSTSKCNFSSYSDYHDIPVPDPKTFQLIDMIDFAFTPPEFINDTDQEALRHAEIMGNAEVIYVPQNSSIVRDAPIVVRLHMAMTLPWTVEIVPNRTYYYRDGNELWINHPDVGRPSTPRARLHAEEQGALQPCLDVLVLIYVREGTVVENWSASLFHLSFTDHASAFYASKDVLARKSAQSSSLRVTNKTEVTTTFGNIEISDWNSYNTYLEAEYGHIAGSIQLHRLISISNGGGDIDVSIDTSSKPPQVEWPPPLLRTTSLKGTTKVKVQVPRKHQCAPHPVHSTSRRFSLDHTTSACNAHELGESNVLQSLDSGHFSTSGYISLVYPSVWKGHIMGLTTTGDISIIGKEVEITSDETDRAGFRMVGAHHGEGNGSMIFENYSGMAKLFVGDDYG
jgi:hypothetical protein